MEVVKPCQYINKMEIKLVFRNTEMQCYVCKMNLGKFSFPKEEEKLQKSMKSVGIDLFKFVE